MDEPKHLPPALPPALHAHTRKRTKIKNKGGQEERVAAASLSPAALGRPSRRRRGEGRSRPAGGREGGIAGAVLHGSGGEETTLVDHGLVLMMRELLGGRGREGGRAR